MPGFRHFMPGCRRRPPYCGCAAAVRRLRCYPCHDQDSMN